MHYFVRVVLEIIKIELREQFLCDSRLQVMINMYVCNCFSDLTQEQQKILIEIRRRKTDLLLQIQVCQYIYFY